MSRDLQYNTLHKRFRSGLINLSPMVSQPVSVLSVCPVGVSFNPFSLIGPYWLSVCPSVCLCLLACLSISSLFLCLDVCVFLCLSFICLCTPSILHNRSVSLPLYLVVSLSVCLADCLSTVYLCLSIRLLVFSHDITHCLSDYRLPVTVCTYA